MSGLSGLITRQNPDGGWPYRRGSSCMEPTLYAVLALIASGESNSPAALRGATWVAQCQRPDGGWPPRPGVDQSTWVTALALLVPAGVLNVHREKALQWLAATSGRESSWIQRTRSFLLDGGTNALEGNGFPWFADTAAWITPTCFGLLALEKAQRAGQTHGFDQRCGSARAYLLSHTCRDGGWNHGSTKALGYDSDSYPETTGQALLALHNASGDRLQRGLDCAQRHLETCRSLEAMCWLQLGLLAHAQKIPEVPVPNGHGSIQEISLNILRQAAVNGRNFFLE